MSIFSPTNWSFPRISILQSITGSLQYFEDEFFNTCKPFHQRVRENESHSIPQSTSRRLNFDKKKKKSKPFSASYKEILY